MIRHREWIRKSKAGDRLAQERLYHAYSRAMYNICFRLLGDRALAEDALQEAFVKAFQFLHRYEEKSTFGAWLKRIVINHCLSELRRRKLLTVSLDEGLPVASEEPEGTFQPESITAERLQAAILSLPEGCRTIFNLYELEGYDHEEISEILGVSISTTKSQLHRARKLLRERLTHPAENAISTDKKEN